MDSTSGNGNSTDSSPPTDSSSSPPSPDSSPPQQSPPPPSDSSPPPPDSSSSSPPPPDSSSSSPPPPDSSSPPPPESSPPPSDSSSSPPPSSPSPPPPRSTPPAQSPPPNNPASSPPPTTPSTPTPPTPIPGGATFSPPTPGAAASRTPPSPVLSPPRPRSPSTSSTPSGSSSSQASVSKPSSSDNNSTNVAIVAGVIGGGVLLLAAVIIGLICLRKKKKRQQYYMEGELPQRKAGKYMMNGRTRPSPMNHNIVNNTPSPGLMGTPGGSWGGVAPSSSDISSAQTQSPRPYNQSEFTYEELAAATGGFSQANVLGQGGFGFVHKGVLPSGVEVAVKSLKAGSGQGEREFQAEVDIISRVHHRHLVSLVGYCIAGQQRMLVYQFVPNKTLEFHLHGKGNPVMDWPSRLRISIGSAKGLAYLHEDCQPRIIHRDIKAANILLDFNFEAMVADFGLAKLTSDNFTHVSTRVMGTFGYLAPEYAASGKLTEKSDVFSFGIMLLELITGRRPVDPTHRVMDDSLVDWARPLLSKALEDGNFKELVDPRLEDNYDPNEMARMVACASAGIRHSARRRPRMSQIVRTLEGASSLEDLNEKPVPNVASSPANVPMATSVYDTRAYNADIVKFRQMILTSGQEGNSSDYGATSEYGLNPSSSSSDSRETDVSSAHKERR